MRVVDVIEGPQEGMLLRRPEDDNWHVQDYFKAQSMALADVGGYPPGWLLDEIQGAKDVGPGQSLKYTAALFISRVARWFAVRPQWILMCFQSEQSLLSVKQPEKLDPECEWTVQEPKEGEKLEDPGKDAWLSKGRLFRLTKGDKRMVFAGGAGAPDPGTNAPWDLARYLGFWPQVYHIGRMGRRDADGWTKGDRKVKLYPTAEDPKGEVVVCGSPAAYALLRWTPNPDVLRKRPGVGRQLGLWV